MEYELEFEALQDATYDADGKYFVGDQIDDPLAAYGLANTENTTYTIDFVSPSGQAQKHWQSSLRQSVLIIWTDYCHSTL